MDWGGVLWHTACLRGPTAQAVGPAPHFISALKGHGAPFNHNPPPLSKADVLIVVDMQNDFIEPDSFVSGCGSFGLSFTLRSSFFFCCAHVVRKFGILLRIMVVVDCKGGGLSVQGTRERFGPRSSDV